VDRLSRPPSAAKPQVSAATILLLAAKIVQPLIKPIAETLGLAPQAAGLIVTMTQIGYGLGLFFVVPLADRVENRRLVLVCVALCAVSLTAAAFAASPIGLLACAGAIGLGSVAVQILIPLSAHLAPDATRGRVVGVVASGLMIGVMGARPVSSFIASLGSWRAMFIASAVMMVALGLRSARPSAPGPMRGAAGRSQSASASRCR
jgi:predicted MFS family arabinose efflux permease